jgi:hypothetical protein
MNDREHLTIRSSLHRAAGTDTAGAYFAMEAIVAPDGGPPSHGMEFFVDGDPRAETT